MSSITVTENNNRVSVDKTTNVVTVTSPGTVGPQGGSGTIDSATATASAVAVDGAGASGTPTAAITLGGTASARTMAFAFGVPPLFYIIFQTCLHEFFSSVLLDWLAASKKLGLLFIFTVRLQLF